MSTVTLVCSVTLDGVMQAPGGPNEDPRGGFARGGWARAYNDPVMAGAMAEGMAQDGALLFGRRTYEQFGSYWPHQTDNPFSDVLNRRVKHVASRTLTEPLSWQNSVLLPGDAADAIAELRAGSGPDLTILGSGDLVGSLRQRSLVDEYLLLIHPLVLGTGRQLFPVGAAPAAMRLVSCVPTTTGVIIATYRPVQREG